MKKTQLYLCFLLLLLTNLKAIAQTPLSGFIPGGDTTYLQKGEIRSVSPVVFGGVKPARGYSYKWHSSPAEVTLGGIRSYILLKSTPATTQEFDIFCEITDATGNSITIQQHVIQTDIFSLLLNQFDVTLRAFATTPQTFEIWGDNSQSLSGYTIETSGSAASFINEVSHTDKLTYTLDVPEPGNYDLTFTLKDWNGKFISSLTRKIEVAPSSAQGMIVVDSVFSINDSQAWGIVLRQQEVIESIQWKTDVPNSSFYGTEWKTDTSTYKWYNENYYKPGSHFVSKTPGTYTLQCRVFLHDGRSISMSKTFTVKNEVGILVGSAEACVGDTVIIPVTFKDLTNEYNISYFTTLIKFDSTILFPIQAVPGRKVEMFSVLIQDRGTLHASDNRLIHLVYEPGDTLYLFHFRILKKGKSPVIVSHTRSTLLTYPGEVGTKDATFTLNSIPGMSMVYQLQPDHSSVNNQYTWTYGIETPLTSNEMHPVISHNTPNSDQEICLEIDGAKECFAKACTTITISPENLYSISGVLENNSRNGIDGEVIAYLIKDGNYYPAGRDTVDVDGSFIIENLGKGDYVLLGIPATPDYQAAYYYNEGLRSNANTIPVTANVIGINFMLDSRSTTPPASVISGSFPKDSKTLQHETLFESFYGTLPSIVILTNNKGEIVDWAKMDDDNNYAFSDPGNEPLIKASYGRVPDELTHNFILTSIAPAEERKYKVYPNPFHQELVIDSKFDMMAELYNFIGQKVGEYKLSKGKNELNLEHLDSGIYLLKAKEDKTLKIIKY